MESAAPRLVAGIRETNDDPVLGLKWIQTEGAGVTAEQVDAFLDFLRRTVSEAGAARFDHFRGTEQLEAVADSPVAWRRVSYCLYPLYMERLTVVPDAEFGETALPVALRRVRPGEWVVSAAALAPGSGRSWSEDTDAWRRWAAAAVAPEGERGEAEGGLTFNVLEIPAEALRSGEIELRPAVLHALAPDGTACDRGDAAAQAAIANAFWQTFWATGALRAERGATFPVAFLPIDRSNPHEFAPPFAERYVSLRRRLFGRTAILSYAIEALTRARALLFDTRLNRFCVASSFVPRPETVAGVDVLLAIRELNRTGFVDAYMGTNREMFAAWRQKEEAGTPGEPSPYGSDGGAGAGAGKIRSHGTPDDYLASVRPSAETPADQLVRIHRVVPYAGCAFLRQMVHERDRLESRGKLQGVEGEILAATNSTFFLNFPEEYGTLHSAMNDPVALLVEDGRTLQVRTMRRAAFLLGEDGRAIITTRAGTKLNTEVLVFEGEGASATFATTADRPFRENRFGPLFFGAVIVGDAIVETFEEIATEIPANGWITGDSEAFGGHIEPTRAAEVQMRIPGETQEFRVRHGFAVGPLLVENGKAVPLGESREEFQPIVLRQNPSVDRTRDLARTEWPEELLNCERHGVPPMRFPYDWDRTRAPRTVLGVRADGTIVLVVIDGRADLPHSVGATLAEEAQLMINLGCESAMNLDGGGSSVMFVNDSQVRGLKLRPDLADGVVNLPSDLGGVERLLPVPLLVCRKRKKTPLPA